MKCLLYFSLFANEFCGCLVISGILFSGNQVRIVWQPKKDVSKGGCLILRLLHVSLLVAYFRRGCLELNRQIGLFLMATGKQVFVLLAVGPVWRPVANKQAGKK